MVSHYLNQWWLIINWTPFNKFHWNQNQNTTIVLFDYSLLPITFSGLVQERSNSILKALELHLSCSSQSIWSFPAEVISWHICQFKWIIIILSHGFLPVHHQTIIKYKCEYYSNAKNISRKLIWNCTGLNKLKVTVRMSAKCMFQMWANWGIQQKFLLCRSSMKQLFLKVIHWNTDISLRL